jgi:hypothetical protein
MKINGARLTRDFILNEGSGPTINTWIQGLLENVAAFKTRTVSESRRIELMKHQLREIRRSARRMNEEISILKETVQVLEEDKEK